MNQPLIDHVNALTAGQPIDVGALRAVPLFGPAAGPASQSLPHALREGNAEVTEVSESGSVNALRVTNSGDQPLLLLNGEELVGAKQNRLVNASILVAAGKRLVIPVSCIEAGRWRHVSRAFASRERVVPSSMRNTASTRVSMSLGARGAYDADQRTVWNDVTTIAERKGVRSATAALSDVLDAEGHRIDDYVREVPAQPGQVGLAVYIAGRLVGVDLLGQPDSYAAAHDRLVRSYAADAIDAARLTTPPAADPADADPITFVTHTLQGRRSEHASPGEGTDVRFEQPTSRVSALCTDEGMVHLTAYAVRAA
jgi:hypothetical protein